MTVRSGQRGYTCPLCRKATHETRKDAKRARRALHPGDTLQVYECEPDSGRWHLGHAKGFERVEDPTVRRLRRENRDAS